MSMPFTERLGALPLVDQHCHSVSGEDLDRAGLERYLTEAPSLGPTLSSFDTPLGVSIRRWCAPVLDLRPHAEADVYVARRHQLGADETNRRFLASAGVTDLCVDGGYGAEELIGPEALGQASASRVHEVLRLESLAESVARSCRPDEFASAFATILGQRGPAAVALKSVVAYRHGFAFRPEPPAPEEVSDAARRWWEEANTSGQWRLTDPVLLRFVLFTASQLGHRLQLHAGLGDPDLRLHRADPSLLADFVETIQPTGTTVILLHCWPYHRQAAYLAAVYPHVFVDVGLALNHVGPSAGTVLAEAMELAPYQKVMYSSDGFGLAELHYLGALRFRRALAGVLDRWVGAGEMSSDYAAWIAHTIGADTARRVYGLDKSSQP
jgi:predicted TIM-barrel fold metal-dependent hydrolase